MRRLVVVNKKLAGRRVGELLMMLSWMPFNGRFWGDN
jgi:hypothetical protein